MIELLQPLMELGWEQWLAVFFNIGYVVLAAKENIWCWPFGLFGVSFLFFIYVDVHLYSDALLQIFYVVMSVYGWISWGKRDSNSQPLRITTLSPYQHLFLICLAGALAGVLGFFWQHFGAALPFIDAFTTSFSILATFLVARKILENWIYWMIIDAVSLYVYKVREIPLIAGLFFIYMVLACYAYISWRKQYRIITS